MKISKVLWMAVLVAVWPARADVVDSSAGGFTIKIAVTIHAAPHEVYSHILHIGEWWDSAHTYSGDAHNLTLDANVNGCFCEKLPNGGGVRHMDVVMVDPDKTLVLRGGLGPLQRMAAQGSLILALSGVPEGTRLELTFAVVGYSPSGMNLLAAPVDAVLKSQIDRLKNAVENGGATAARAR